MRPRVKDVYDFIQANARFYYCQCIRKYGDRWLAKTISVANYDSEGGHDRSHHVVAPKFTVVVRGKKWLVTEYIKRQVEECRQKGVIPEVHISHVWYYGGPFIYDLVIDIEKGLLSVNIGYVEDVVRYLKTYGMKPCVKLSSIMEWSERLVAGFHVHVDLSTLLNYFKVEDVEKIAEKWNEFYNSLIDKLMIITGHDDVLEIYGCREIPKALRIFDRAFASKEEHMIRAFLSPKVENNEFWNISIPINVEWAKMLVKEGKGHVLLKKARNLDYCLRYVKVPRSGVVNPKLFLALFNGLTGTKLDLEVLVSQPTVNEISTDPFHTPRLVLPQYVRLILEKGVNEGYRNRATFILATWFKAQGLQREEVLKKLLEWNTRNRPPLPEREIEHVVKSVFTHPYKPVSRKKAEEWVESLNPLKRKNYG